jgi:hypothetical protein
VMAAPLSTMMASINSKGGGRRKFHGSFVDTRVCFLFFDKRVSAFSLCVCLMYTKKEGLGGGGGGFRGPRPKRWAD